MNMESRKGDWIQTFTGLAFWPIDPRPDEIRLEDIVGALSKLCRFGGHCLRFYSVAEHCVHVASQAPSHLKLAALMHDASEAYLVDVPRPIKPWLPEYVEIEKCIEKAIAIRFNLHWPVANAVKQIDDRILEDERIQAMADPPRPWKNFGSPLGVTLQFWSPETAAERFRTAFFEYGGRDA
jgi:uncharacterized protein